MTSMPLTEPIDGHEPYWNKITPRGYRFFTNVFPALNPFDGKTVDEAIEDIETRYGASNVYVSDGVYDIDGNQILHPDARAVFIREDALSAAASSTAV